MIKSNVERDLILLSMISEYFDSDLKQIIPHIKKDKLLQLHNKTLKDDEHIVQILAKIANESYKRLEKKLDKLPK